MLAGVSPVDAAQIDAAFCRIGTALMIDVDAAGLTEIVFRRMAAPSVKAEVFRPFEDGQTGGPRGDSRSAPADAEGTIAAAGRGEAAGQLGCDFNRAAVAAGMACC